MNNDELIAAGHELAKCLDSNTPLLDIAKMIVRLADKLDVTTAALREKTKQCEQLAADDAALNNRMQKLIQIINNADNSYCMCGEAMETHAHGGCGHPTGMFDYHYNAWLDADTETPATDAFLREVRAQGVDMAACALDGVNQFNYANMLDELAQKLRQGGAA
ncbi:hypothetical protein [Cronobacter dublinensis]|uniref:hypothetical protein n=1 Tax=Cronobacter dublinensis TaxID=413497 RepID=UPI001375A155|nr:hypothetical protein [Cronobacter dublinensis]NCH71992.1 hypothetical protein [Cronobacter dublinensis]